MNTSNLKIIEEVIEKKQKTYFVSRINPRLPWPPNATLAVFVSNGDFRKYKIVSEGDENVKIVLIK